MFGAFFTFTLVATFVWGGLAVALRIMLTGEEEEKVFEEGLEGKLIEVGSLAED